MEEIKTSIIAIKAKMEKSSAEERTVLAKKLDSLQKKYRDGVEKMQDLSEIDENFWEGMQDDLETFWDQLTRE